MYGSTSFSGAYRLLGETELRAQRVVLQLYRRKVSEAGSISLDEELRMHDKAEMSRPRRKNPLVTLGNVAMLAAAAGIATALCREVQVTRTRALHLIYVWLAKALRVAESPLCFVDCGGV